MPEELRNCPDCGVAPGTFHLDRCCVEACSVCGGRRAYCPCTGHDPLFSRWTGISPGEAEAKFLGITLQDIYALKLDRIFFVKPTGKA